MSTRTAALAVALAAVVLLAGCGSQSEGTATPTLTPGEVPAESLAPGVTERGVVDAQRLVEAHREAFRDGVVRTHRHRQTWANGTRVVLTERRFVGSGSCRRYLFTSTAVVGTDAPREVALYANGTHVFERRAHPRGNSTRLLIGPSGERRRPCTVGAMDPLGDERLYAVLGRGGFAVEASGDRVRLTARNVSLSPMASRAGRITNVTADVEAVVTSDGAVRRLAVTYAGETPDGRITGVRVDRFRLSDGIERPAWVANASAETASASARTPGTAR